MDQPRQRPTTDEIVSNLSIQLLQLRGCCQPCSPRCQLQISPSTAPSPVKTEDHDECKVPDTWPAPNSHIMPPRRLESPKKPNPSTPADILRIGASPSTWESQVAVLPRFMACSTHRFQLWWTFQRPSKIWTISTVTRSFNGQPRNSQLSRAYDHGTNTRHPDCNHNIILCVGSPATAEPSRPDPRE